MAREKGGVRTRQNVPSLIQDHTGLEDRISNTIIGTFVAPLEERVTAIETTLGAIGQIERGVVYEIDVPLKRGRHGGSTVVELPTETVDDAIGRTVLVNQAHSGDADEGGIVLFTGTVLDRRHILFRWFCAFPAPKVVKVVYLIG